MIQTFFQNGTRTIERFLKRNAELCESWKCWILRGWRDAKALNIPRHRDAKLNELPNQICYAAASAASAAASAVCTYYAVIWGRFAPPYKYTVKYIQQKQQQKQQRQQH